MADDIKLRHGDGTENVSFINGGRPIIMRGARLSYAFKPLTRVTPNTNAFALTEAQITGYENPKIIVTGYIDTNDTTSDIITQSLLLQLSKNEYDGTDSKQITLTVNTGDNPTYLIGTESSTSQATSQSIKVIIESFNLNIDPSDNDLGYLWTYTLNLVETA